MIIAIDFDGTVCIDRYPGFGPLVPNAKKVINQLHSQGHYIIINTCRAGNELISAINYLLEKGIKFDRVNDNHPEMTAKYGVTRKVFADVYIDDRNFGGLPLWLDVYDQIQSNEQY